MKKRFSDESCAEAEAVLSAITDEVNRQQRAYYRIFSEQILPELNRQNIYLYQSETVEPFHQEFVCRYFNEEVFPFLSPVMIQRDEIRTFIRDRRLYLIVGIEGEKLLLADGKYREAANPKTKNKKHVRLLPVFHAEIAERLGLGKDENSEIRAALKAAAEERK